MAKSDVAQFERRMRKQARATSKAIKRLSLKDPESIHQARVELRRFASLLLELGWLYTDLRLVHRAIDELKAVHGQLQKVRDLQVMIDLLAGFSESSSADTSAGFEILRRALSKQLSAASKRLRRRLRAGRLRGGFAKAAKSFARLEPVPGTTEQLDGAIHDYLRSELIVLGKRVSETDLDAADSGSLHKLRIAIKRVRYVAAFAAPDETERPELQKLAHAQDLLGKLNDGHVLAAFALAIADRNPAAAGAVRLLQRRLTKRESVLKAQVAELTW